MRRALPQVIVGALALSGCTSTPAPTPAAPPVPQVGAAGVSTPAKPAVPRDRTPRSLEDYGTNDGALALHNLESQIDGMEKTFARTKDFGIYNALIGLYLQRGINTGHIADYTHALSLADAWLKAQPQHPLAWMSHAACMSTLHRFDDALKDYAKAEKLGFKTIELVAPRMSIDQARGVNGDAVLAYREKIAKEIPDINSFMMLAIEQGDRGQIAEATKSYGEAQDIYRDVSPFPVANLYFQEGLLEQRMGSPARARELFENAHARVPSHAQITSHLASVLAVTGAKPRAIALLEPLATADDPEYAGQLAALLADDDKDRAATLRADATKRYEALVKSYPLAFSDHAARFYLSTNDPKVAKRALELAKINVANRPTLDAQRLVVDAAIAAGDTKLACSTADTITARKFVPPEAHVTASKAYAACGQKDRADKEVAAMAAPSQGAPAPSAMDAGQ